MIYFYLFLTFFQIGLFGFGGGYGMFSFTQTETAVHHHWLSSAEFTNIVAISQMIPGPIGINSATYYGYAAMRNADYGMSMAILGSVTATFTSVFPSLTLMILISKIFMKHTNTEPVQSVFDGPRPAVVGLLGVVTLLFMNEESFGFMIENPWRLWISVASSCIIFTGTKYMKIDPIRMICYVAFAGLMLLY